MSTTLEPTLRRELPPLPERMKRLKLDRRGYPVPWFVTWLAEESTPEHPIEVSPGDGYPEFRVLRPSAIPEALKFERCWICGGQLGRFKAFVIGPMCMVNRINSEPPSHVECADFAARACPFLSRPHMTRRENNMPIGGETAGIAIDRNPGVGIVWITNRGFPIKRVSNGILFELPEPTEVRAYCEGRPATREEVKGSVESGLPLLLEHTQTPAERREVHELLEISQRFWPSD